jgi:ABC-type polysaccharide/polyol phosphate transport system ATPase subunit
VSGKASLRGQGPLARTPRPGEIVLEEASRSFALVHERSRTLKELFLRRGRGKRSEVKALDGVNLQVEPGEAVGLIGRNGAGKTSTLRCLAGIVPLDSGRAELGGRVVSLLELAAGFGPEFSGRENVWLGGALHGFGREEMAERVDRILEFAELGEFIDVPVKAYSAGMLLRLGFSIVAHLDADVMLIDEILAVGDEAFQRKCLARISNRMEAGATLVLVSHDPTAIERVCRRVVVLDAGRVAFDGGVAEGLLFYHRLLGTEKGGSRSVRPSADRDPFEVTELELHDSDGRRRHVFRPGEPLHVRLALDCAAPTARAVAALEVRDERGGLCFRTDAAIGAVEGRVSVGFDVARLALLGGDYDVAVGIGEGDAPGVGKLDRVARFSVARTAGGEGVADLRGTWTVEPAVAPVAVREVG